MGAETILKEIKKETKEISKWENKKVSEKDYLLAIIIVSVIAISFFVYVNFIPKLLFKTSVDIIEITGCNQCFDVKSLSDGIIKANENIKVERKSIDYNSDEAKSLIEKYEIKRIPASIITSKNLDKIDLVDEQTFLIGNNYAVFDKGVPYVDLNSDRVKGLVNLKEIQDTNCKNCMSLFQIQEQLENWGVKIDNSEIVDSSFPNGKKLIKDNKLTFLPSLLISKDIEEYWWVFPQIKNSFVEKGDYYLFKNSIPPYKEISTGQIKGIVDIMYIENKTCKECFNVTQLGESFQSLGVYIEKERFIDISSNEGKDILSKYNITFIPTVILSREVQDYETIKKTLEQVGTFEKDGLFVFRKLDSLNVKYQEIK